MIFLRRETEFKMPKTLIEDMIAHYLIETIGCPETNGIIYTNVIDFEENQRINSKIHFSNAIFVDYFEMDNRWSIFKAENEGYKYLFYVKNEWLSKDFFIKNR